MAGISDLFSDKQIDEFKEAFTLFDGNKDGTVFLAQVEGVLKALGIHANETDLRVIVLSFYCKFKMLIIKRLMMEADGDDSGTIDFPEFLSLMALVVLHNFRILIFESCVGCWK